MSVKTDEAPVVLLVEDNLALAEVYRDYLAGEPWELLHVRTGHDALELLKSRPIHAMCLDLQLPDVDGMAVLRWLNAQNLPTRTVIVTGNASVDALTRAEKLEAYDFIVKPFTPSRLKVTLRNALRQLQLSSLLEAYQSEYDRERYHGFIGSSLAMQAIYRIIENAAPSRASVFITGESGTGKEVCAQAIHRQGPRSNKPFIAINCAAIPRDLMESEIFGHLRGGFTGAHRDRDGAAALADGGTLFLDEICEMDLELQAKFLRFVQTGTFQRVGSSRVERVDVRFVCATNRDPIEELEAGRLREDLYYRLHVVPIALPPLRERDNDVVVIARQFLMDYVREERKHFKGFSAETEDILRSYAWPGNVRQLQNVIRNIVVLNDGERVTPHMLPEPLNALRGASNGRDRSDPAASMSSDGDNGGGQHTIGVKTLAAMEREHIESAIAACDGNIPKAAALLGISPSTIYRKRQSWKLD